MERFPPESLSHQESSTETETRAGQLITRVRERVQHAASRTQEGNSKLKASIVGALYFFTIMEGAVGVSKEQQDIDDRSITAEQFDEKLLWPEKGTQTYDDMGPEDYKEAFRVFPGKLQKVLLEALHAVDIREGTEAELQIDTSRYKDTHQERFKHSITTGHVEYFGIPEFQRVVLFTQAAERIPLSQERYVFFHELGHVLHGGGDVERITEKWKKVMQESAQESSDYPASLTQEDDKTREDFAESFAQMFDAPFELFEQDSIRFRAMRNYIRERIKNSDWDPRMDWLHNHVYFAHREDVSLIEILEEKDKEY